MIGKMHNKVVFFTLWCQNQSFSRTNKKYKYKAKVTDLCYCFFFTQQIYKPKFHHIPNVDDVDNNVLSPLMDDDVEEETDEEEEEEDDTKYSALLEKLQNFFNDLGIDDDDEEEEDGEDDDDPMLDGYQGYADMYRHSRPLYGKQGKIWRCHALCTHFSVSLGSNCQGWSLNHLTLVGNIF